MNLDMRGQWPNGNQHGFLRGADTTHHRRRGQAYPAVRQVWRAATIALFALEALNGRYGAGDDRLPIDVGARRELFVDDHLIAELHNAHLELQTPSPREVVIVHNAPWEGNICTYHTVFQDGDVYRMYYRGGHVDDETGKPSHPEVVCYAESADGVRWTKPSLGICEFDGSKDNNIILTDAGTHNFAPFKDANPDATTEGRYKAVASGNGGLLPFQSPDGVHWSLIQSKPVITDGAFDSLNVAYWDVARAEYVAFFRDFRDSVRDIKSCTSKDFLHWSDPQWLVYEGAPNQHLYTNAIVSYFRAPEFFVGLPKRFNPSPNPQRHRAPGVSDCGLMTSRDGVRFRRWAEALVRPGQQQDRWVNRNNLAAWGIVPTKPDVPGSPDELSIYLTEGYYRGPAVRLRRYTLRLDGFVSISAGADGGEMVTSLLALSDQFRRPELCLNFATSAFGSVRGELQDASGKPIPGFELASCEELIGDKVDAALSWNPDPDWSQLQKSPFRLRLILADADVFALRFREAASQKESNATSVDR